MNNAFNPVARVLAYAAQNPPSMGYDGSDFAQWQAKARAKLFDLLGLDKMVPCEMEPTITQTTEKETHTQIDFTFHSEPGFDVPCAILMPKAAGKHPLAICLQGHSTGMHISLGQPKYARDAASIAGGRDFAVQALANGYCALVMEQRGMGITGGDPETGETQCQVHTMANTLMGRTTIGERVWDIDHAIDAVGTLFADRVDLDNILCMGNSGGGTSTFYAACMLPRITNAIASCSFCSYDQSIMALQHCTCNFVPGIRKYFDMGDLSGLIAPRGFVVVAGRNDGIFPLPGVQKSFEQTKALYAIAGVPDACAMVVGDKGHQFYPEIGWPAVEKFAKAAQKV